jgi:hypothetical protein
MELCVGFRTRYLVCCYVGMALRTRLYVKLYSKVCYFCFWHVIAIKMKPLSLISLLGLIQLCDGKICLLAVEFCCRLLLIAI